MLLEGLETLLMLHKTKTMSRTGSMLYISQSAVSKRIAALEKKLGKKLVVPDGRQVKLTHDAEHLIANVAPTFSELQGLMFDQQRVAEKSPILLDCSETLVSGYLSGVLSACFKRDPYLSITTNHTPRILEHVQSGKSHIGICAGYLPGTHGLLAFHLMDEPFYIVSDRQLQTFPARIITNDLKNPANSYQLSILQQLGIAPVMEMDSYAAAAQLALAGIAPALVPFSVLRTMGIAPETCLGFDDSLPLYRPVNLLVRQNAYRNDRVKTVITAIVDAFATAV